VRVHVCHLIHALGPGGAEQVLVDLARVAPAVGLRVSVIALTGDADSVHARQLRSAGASVTSLRLRSRWDPRAFPRAARAVRAMRPDLLHAHMKHADLVAAVTSLRLKIPVVSTLHVVDDQPGPVARGKRWLAGLARRRFTARTIAVSEAQRRWYLSSNSASPDDVTTIHNGVLVETRRISTAEREAIRAGFDVRPEQILVANVAIMRPGKGQEDLLAAVSILPEASPVVVVLIGDGDGRPGLEQMARTDPAIGDRTRFAGYREDVPRILQASDILAHPSHADALPTAVIHAMAAGLPVVASEVGGIPEILGDTGILVPPGDPRTLSQTLEELASDPGRRAALGSAAHQRFTDSFGADTWAQRLLGLYREVAPSGPRTHRG